jgi:hypothetical protein
VVNKEFGGFEGKYSDSVKTPDLAIEFQNAARNHKPKFILEVSFMQTYEDLVRDTKLWLEGKSEVCIVMVAKCKEIPHFRCPAHGFGDEQLPRLGFPKASEISELDYGAQHEYGPVTFKGLEWVGSTSAAFAKVWRRHPISGLATQSGNHIVSYQ